jgi:hypothetical protein
MIRALGISLGSAVVILLGSFICAGSDMPASVAKDTFMRQKLDCSQSILEAIALERFDLVSKNAVQLRNMTTNDLWAMELNSSYVGYSVRLQKTLDLLRKVADEKDLNRVTEAYGQVARNCTECHRHVRSERSNVARLAY